eukprot:s2657_g8.t1
METDSVVLLEENPDALFLLTFVSEVEDGGGDAILSQALFLLRRDGGVLLAVPPGAIPAEHLSEAAEGDPFTPFGAHTVVTVPARGQEGLDGIEEIEVLVIDADVAVRNSMQPMPAAQPEETLTFALDPHVMPATLPLMAAARSWVSLSQQDPVIAYYSAVEEAANGEAELPQTPKAPGVKATAKAKAKRMTTATLAEKLTELADVLPMLSSQITELQRGQEDLRAQVSYQSNAVPPRPSQQPVSAPLQSFAKMLGSPPRARAPAPNPKAGHAVQPQTTVSMVDGEEIETPVPGGGILAQAVLEQSKALTNLVAQLQQGSDPLLDGQAGGSTFSLGSRGAQGREKLQQDLAHRTGGFFLSVYQNACRRMKPASKVPMTLEAAQQQDLSMVTYLEKFGGYGNCRELGMIQCSLAHVFDCALNEDMEGVKEHIALTMTAIEQAAQDNNKWDLAYQLTLLEEPPSQIWSYRPAVTQSRLRAFAPLCPQKWATVALAYSKEVDYIQNRKAELNKKHVPSQESPATNPKPKPKRKQKWQGGESAGSSNKQSEEA